MGYAALAEVLAGWTGTIAVTSSGTTVTVTPHLRESVASLFARVAQESYAKLGVTLGVSVYDLGGGGEAVLRITATSTVTITFTGNCGARTDYDSGPYTGTDLPSEGVGSGPTGVYVPTRGLALDGSTYGGGEGRAVSTGAYGFAGPAEAGNARLRMWSSFSDTWGNEDLEGVYDVWHDGRILGRGRIDSVTRTRMGRLSNQVVMSCEFQGCTE